jgi:hypothetical protein
MFFKRKQQQEPEAQPADYCSWDHESLLSVFPVCTHHPNQRSVVVKVLPAEIGKQEPIPLCMSCDAADRV